MHHHDADSIRAWLMRLEFPHLESCFLGLLAAEDFDISEDPIERTTIVRPFPPEFHAAYPKPQL
jgi:hypothetical protein